MSCHRTVKDEGGPKAIGPPSCHFRVKPADYQVPVPPLVSDVAVLTRVNVFWLVPDLDFEYAVMVYASWPAPVMLTWPAPVPIGSEPTLAPAVVSFAAVSQLV